MLFQLPHYRKNRDRIGTRRAERPGTLVVRRRPGHASRGQLIVGGQVFACALGRAGIRALKREGDGATPLGRMRLLHGYYREGRLQSRRTRLPLRPIGERSGWCDEPGDRNYNRPVRLPYPAGHERMFRDDDLYDCCIVLDYNIRPRRRGAGSAIFMHVARPGFLPTEGCIAVTMATMRRLLPRLGRGTVLLVLP